MSFGIGEKLVYTATTAAVLIGLDPMAAAQASEKSPIVDCRPVIDETGEYGEDPTTVSAVLQAQIDAMMAEDRIVAGTDIRAFVRLYDNAGFTSEEDVIAHADDILDLCTLGRRAVVAVVDNDSGFFDIVPSKALDPTYSQRQGDITKANLLSNLQNATTPEQDDAARALYDIDPKNRNVVLYGPNSGPTVPDNTETGTSDSEPVTLPDVNLPDISLPSIDVDWGKAARYTSVMALGIGAVLRIRRGKLTARSQRATDSLITNAINDINKLSLDEADASRVEGEVKQALDDIDEDQKALLLQLQELRLEIRAYAPPDPEKDKDTHELIRVESNVQPLTLKERLMNLAYPDLGSARGRYDEVKVLTDRASEIGRQLAPIITRNNQVVNEYGPNLAQIEHLDTSINQTLDELKGWDLSSLGASKAALEASVKAIKDDEAAGYYLRSAKSAAALIESRQELISKIAAARRERAAASENFDGQANQIAEQETDIALAKAELERLQRDYAISCSTPIIGQLDVIDRQLIAVRTASTNAGKFRDTLSPAGTQQAVNANTAFNVAIAKLRQDIAVVMDHGAKLDKLRANLPGKVTGLDAEHNDLLAFIKTYEGDVEDVNETPAYAFTGTLEPLEKALKADKPDYLELEAAYKKTRERWQEIANKVHADKQQMDDLRAEASMLDTQTRSDMTSLSTLFKNNSRDVDADTTEAVRSIKIPEHLKMLNRQGLVIEIDALRELRDRIDNVMDEVRSDIRREDNRRAAEAAAEAARQRAIREAAERKAAAEAARERAIQDAANKEAAEAAARRQAEREDAEDARRAREAANRAAQNAGRLAGNHKAGNFKAASHHNAGKFK